MVTVINAERTRWVGDGKQRPLDLEDWKCGCRIVWGNLIEEGPRLR